MSSGDFGAFLIGTIIFSVGFGFFLVCSIQLDNSKEYEEWTPEKGAKKANNIAVKYNLTEKEYLLSVFNNIVKYDQQLEIATDSSEIINTINQINIFKRKVASVYQEVLTEEKSKSINRYSKSVMYNKILDGNYSASDHIRATKRIQAKETLRLEGFVIALAHLDRSLIWADELLLKFGK